MKNVLFALVVLAAGQAWAELPAFSFKGVPMGASESEFLSTRSEFECRQSSSGAIDRWCAPRSGECARVGVAQYGDCLKRERELTTFAGAFTKGMSAYFIANKLGRVNITMHHNWFESVRGSMIEKFGKPKSAVEQLTTRMGVKHEGIVDTWAFPDGRIVLTEYSGDIESSEVLYVTEAYADATLKNKQQAVKSGAKDL